MKFMMLNLRHCILGILLLLIFATPAALAVDIMDNAHAEKLCWKAIGEIDYHFGTSTYIYDVYWPYLARRLKGVIEKGSEEYVCKKLLPEYCEALPFWLTDRELKSMGITRRAESISRINPRTTPAGGKYNLLVVIEDNNAIAGSGENNVFTFCLGAEEVGFGPFKHYEWRIVDIKIKVSKKY